MPRSNARRIAAALAVTLVTAGAGSVVAAAAGADAVGTISVTNPTTVFARSGGSVSVRAPGHALTWTASDVNAVVVGSGTARLAHGRGRVPLPRVGPGWYSLHLASGGSAVDTTFAVVDGAPVPAAGNQFGVQIHPQSASRAETTAVAAMGQGSARIDLRWEDVEKSAGVYTFDPVEDTRIRELQRSGVRPLLIMGYFNPLYDDNRTPSTPAGIAAYARYAAASARHYGTGVDYEIYNEYNLGFSNGACGQGPDCFFALLGPTADAIHRAVRGARVVGPALGGFTPYWVGAGAPNIAWMKRLYDLGGLRYLDVISMHNYSFPATPENNNEAAVRAVRSLTDSYRDGAQKLLWMTETGAPTVGGTAGGVSEYEQAEYLVRDAALSQRAGLDRYMVYDMLDDYPDPTNPEGRFGLVHNPAEAAGTVAPKPGYVAYAVLTRQLAGYRAAGSDDVGAAAYSVRFARAGAPVRRVLWSPTSASVLVHSSTPVTVTAAQGGRTTLRPTRGLVPLTLGPDPVYVSGAGVTSVTTGSAVYSAVAVAPVLQGSPARATVHVDTSEAGAARGELTFTSGYGASTTLRGTSTGSIALPAFPQAGPVRVPVTVSSAGHVVGRVVVTATVEADPAATVVPVSGALGSASTTLDIAYRGARGPVAVSDVAWTVGDRSGTSRPGAALRPDGRVSVSLPTTGLPLWTPEPYSITYRFSDGVSRTVIGTTAFAPTYADDHPSPPAADLDTAGHWHDLGGGRSGASDVSGRLWLSRSTRGVTVHAEVVDDVHQAAADAPILWQDDSIQFGFAPGLPGSGAVQSEFGAALLASGPAVYRFSGAGGLEADATATITRSESTHTTSYAVTLPWSAIGVPADASRFSFSLLVNDADGAGRKGFLEWGSGIGVLKDASQYLPIERA